MGYYFYRFWLLLISIVGLWIISINITEFWLNLRAYKFVSQEVYKSVVDNPDNEVFYTRDSLSPKERFLFRLASLICRK